MLGKYASDKYCFSNVQICLNSTADFNYCSEASKGMENQMHEKLCFNIRLLSRNDQLLFVCLTYLRSQLLHGILILVWDKTALTNYFLKVA